MERIELIKLKSNKPTRHWRKSLPMLTRIVLFRSFSRIDASLNLFVEQLISQSNAVSNETIMKIVQTVVVRLNDIDEKGGIIETSEREDLCEFIG